MREVTVITSIVLRNHVHHVKVELRPMIFSACNTNVINVINSNPWSSAPIMWNHCNVINSDLWSAAPEIPANAITVINLCPQCVFYMQVSSLYIIKKWKMISCTKSFGKHFYESISYMYLFTEETKFTSSWPFSRSYTRFLVATDMAASQAIVIMMGSR